MALVFFYVQVAYSVIEPAIRSSNKHPTQLWQERKKAAEKLLKVDKKKGKENSAALVTPPKEENTLFTQLPSLEQNILPRSLHKFEEFGASAGDYTILSGEQKVVSQKIVKKISHLFKPGAMSYASFREIYVPPKWNPNDLMVFQIQDVHENYEAQRNIARIIESLSEYPIQSFSSSNQFTKNQPQLVVGLEGASGAMNFEPYRSFPDKEITKVIADHFLKESFISGAEYVGMTLGLDFHKSIGSSPQSQVLFRKEQKNFTKRFALHWP
ncbi:MAG: hypothetical protein HYT97_07610 [Elusimicrobia bacterium]|nr:hypothetical protein [Elusimicrobiota bacterium]